MLNAGEFRYRADIDGLRAVAVLLVIAFHAAPNIIAGGYIGVDVFFVISGYLITGLILHELRGKDFSFARFYARRIRRLFPALIAVLIACIAVGWFLLLPDEFASLGANVFGGAAFSANIVLFRESGYFDVAAAMKPLLHLWSLGVEEQFYIVWPALVLLFWRRSIFLIAAGVFVVSFAWNAAHAGTTGDFFLPWNRAWELMIGGIVFVAIERNMLPRSTLAGLLGLVLILAAAGLLTASSAFPGWWALLPTCGAALLLTSEGTWINRAVLAHPAAVGIGLISYPLYLWHWPLLSFAAIVDPARDDLWLRVAAVALAGALAFATYRWIERPIRRGGGRSLKIVGLCVCMALLGIVGLTTYAGGGFPQRIPAALRNVTAIPFDRTKEWRLGQCMVDQVDDTPPEHFLPTCIETKRPLVFLWGDSFAAALYPGLHRLQATREFGLTQLTTAGCPPILDFPVLHRPHCVEDNAYVFDKLSESHPDIVLLYSAWNYGDVYPHLADLVAKLRALKVPHIIVMGPPPVWAGGLSKAAVDYYQTHRAHPLIPTYSDFRLDRPWHEYDEQFAKHVKALGAEYISTWDVFCRDGKCRTWVDRPGGELTAFDTAHLTLAGATFLTTAIEPCLFPNGDAPPQYCYPASALSH